MLHAAFEAELGVFRTDRAATSYPVEKLGYMEVGPRDGEPDGRRGGRRPRGPGVRDTAPGTEWIP
jgi:hypothetical protein